MPKLLDVREKGSYRQLPQVSRSEIRLLWIVGFWDIPLTGMLLYHERKYWYEICEGQDEEDKNIRYLIVEVSPEQLQVEEYWHELFRKKVGTHTDFDESGQRTTGAVKHQSTHHEFYEPYQKSGYKHDFSENNVIGWFEYWSYSNHSQMPTTPPS